MNVAGISNSSRSTTSSSSVGELLWPDIKDCVHVWLDAISGISASPMFLPLGHSDHVGRHGCAHSLFPVRTSVWTNFHPHLRFGWKTWNSYIDEEDNIADGIFGGNGNRWNSRSVGLTNPLNHLLMRHEGLQFHISWDHIDESMNLLNPTDEVIQFLIPQWDAGWFVPASVNKTGRIGKFNLGKAIIIM